MDDDNNPRIVDFGLARLEWLFSSHALTEDGSPTTMAYLPPESETKDTLPADVFSFARLILLVKSYDSGRLFSIDNTRWFYAGDERHKGG